MCSRFPSRGHNENDSVTVKRTQNTDITRENVHWPHPFIIHCLTTDGRGTAHFTAVLQCQNYEWVVEFEDMKYVKIVERTQSKQRKIPTGHILC